MNPPTTQLPTDAAVLSALRASVERFGVLVPIVFDQHGEMIDGHHRRLLADELGRSCPKVTVTLPDDPDERAQAILDINDARRQKLTAEQRRDIAKALREQGHSTRAIAAVVGASKSAVDRDLQQLSQAGQLEAPAAVTGLDGRTRPATRPEPEEPEPERLSQAGQLVPMDDDLSSAVAAATEACHALICKLVQVRADEGFEWYEGFSDKALGELGGEAFHLLLAIEGEPNDQADYDSWSRRYEVEQS